MSAKTQKEYLADLGKNELNSPDFTLAAETEFTANTEFLVQTFTFIRTTGSTEGKTIYTKIRNGKSTRESDFGVQKENIEKSPLLCI